MKTKKFGEKVTQSYASIPQKAKDVFLSLYINTKLERIFSAAISEGKINDLDSSLVPTKTGYVFKGYWTLENGQGNADDNDLRDNDSNDLNGNPKQKDRCVLLQKDSTGK